MKPIYLLLILICFSTNGFNQIFTLDSLYVSDVGTTDMVEVTVVTSKSNDFSYIGSNYSVNSNIINLSVCYFFPEFASATETTITKKLYVFLPVGITNFTLNLNLYNSQSATSCDYYENLDSASLNFTFPLSDTVFLSSISAKEKELSMNVYPNPAQNVIKINSNGKIIEYVQLYNILGEMVLEQSLNSSTLNVENIENGIYFVIAKTNEGILKKKIVVSK